MPKAIVKNGSLHLLEPLPPEWQDGTEVQIVRPAVRNGSDSPASATDQWMDEVEAVAAQTDPEDDERLTQVISQIRQEAKDLARLDHDNARFSAGHQSSEPRDP